MTTPLESLVLCGTKLWLDSVDPDLVTLNKDLGATGATSNPIIISDLLKSGRFDSQIQSFVADGLSDEEIAWRMTDQLVTNAQGSFTDVNTHTNGNDGFVSFELDPLLEDASCTLSTAERADRYVELGKQWAAGHTNRMIKIPATPAGLAAVERLAAAGVTLNVTLIFSSRQYQEARDAVWRGAQKLEDPNSFKSVYSIFVSRIDVYTKNQVAELSDAAQGQVGILNAQRIWAENQAFWADKPVKLQQEIIFASTGTKDPSDPVDKYVSALAGSDIQTNPPGTNSAIQELGDRTYAKQVDSLPADEIVSDIDEKVDFEKMEQVLMEEGLKKFADPHKGLIALIGEKRAALQDAA